jgi:predicted GTPase
MLGRKRVECKVHRLGKDLTAMAEKIKGETKTPLTIAVFGEGKNGKTTALNAIVGEELR